LLGDEIEARYRDDLAELPGSNSGRSSLTGINIADLTTACEVVALLTVLRPVR
jgi:hypothetical protein